MKQIGIIFSEKIFKKVPPYIQVTDDMSLLDSDLPKLIIGLELSKRHIDNFSIIEKKANDNLYWTFKKTEKRNDYEKDLNNFYKEVIKNISSLTEYKYVNVIAIDKKRLFKIAKILNDVDKIKVFYFLDNIFYVLYDNVIYGFSSEIIDYIGINKNRLEKFIKSGRNIYIMNDYIQEFKGLDEYFKIDNYLKPYFFHKLMDNSFFLPN